MGINACLCSPARNLRNFASVALLLTLVIGAEADENTDRIQPYAKNPRYWQYQGKPVMLLGASKTDHLFLLDDLESHLDEIASYGGNYVRNTMSQREGLDLKAHKRLTSGKFDLEQWNPEYWTRFQNMLKWTAVRDIIVQIEVWDRFDYTDASGWNFWQHSPWRPANNVNYTEETSGLADTYKDHPTHDKQPFFHTAPRMKRYRRQYDLVRYHQERFVAKMLSHSLDYGHVLYCMNNETSTPAEWGQHWIQFIQDTASSKGVTVCTTDMFDDAFDADKARHTPIIFKDAEHYMFADISQVNSRIYDDTHWDRLRLLLRLVNSHPRPTNHVKIYGGGYTSWGSGAPEDAVERFWRDLLGGSAAVRFHRPGHHHKLSQRMWGSVAAARLLADRINLWDVTPRMDLLADRDENEAFLAAQPGEAYAIYFTHGGSAGLNLSEAPGNYELTWISVSEGTVTETTSAKLYARTAKSVTGGRIVTLTPPYKGGWVAVIAKK